jgi:hypothetical protein
MSIVFLISAMKYTLSMFMPLGGKMKLPTALVVDEPFERCVACDAERSLVAQNRVEYRCGCCLAKTDKETYAVLSCCPYAMAAVSDLRVRRIVRNAGKQLLSLPVGLLESLSVGSRVRWVSQSAGRETVKTGVIVAVVPSNARPEKFIPKGFRQNSTTGYGRTRDHKSYLVQVRGKGNMVYWPRVYALEKIG